MINFEVIVYVTCKESVTINRYHSLFLNQEVLKTNIIFVVVLEQKTQLTIKCVCN